MAARTRVKQRIVQTRPRRVVVASRMAGIAGQDKLNGIFDYLSEGRRWQLIIFRTKQEFTADVVEHELSRGADGFIVGIPDTDDALARLAACGVPTVVMNITGGGIENRARETVFVGSLQGLRIRRIPHRRKLEPRTRMRFPRHARQGRLHLQHDGYRALSRQGRRQGNHR